MTTATINQGNNETLSIGIVRDGAGYLALTLTASKSFKTYGGAAKWLATRGYRPDGTKLAK